jgi:inner membrane transporter RhtA
LIPVIPFSLELLALRRLNTAAFGTLMSLEPAIALTIGLVVLGQVPAPTSAAGVILVVAAGIGAERTGARRDRPLTCAAPRTDAEAAPALEMGRAAGRPAGAR